MAKSVQKAERAWQREGAHRNPIRRARAYADLIRAYLYAGRSDDALQVGENMDIPPAESVKTGAATSIVFAHAWAALARFDIGLEFGSDDLLFEASATLDDIAAATRDLDTTLNESALLAVMNAISDIWSADSKQFTYDVTELTELISDYLPVTLAEKHPILPVLAAETMYYSSVTVPDPGRFLRRYASIYDALEPNHPLVARYERIDDYHPEIALLPAPATNTTLAPMPIARQIQVALASVNFAAARAIAIDVDGARADWLERDDERTRRHETEAWAALARMGSAFTGSGHADQIEELGAAVNLLAGLTNEGCTLPLYRFTYGVSQLALALDGESLNGAMQFRSDPDVALLLHQYPYLGILLIDALAYAGFDREAADETVRLSSDTLRSGKLSAAAREYLNGLDDRGGPLGRASRPGTAGPARVRLHPAQRLYTLTAAGDFAAAYDLGLDWGVDSGTGAYAEWTRSDQIRASAAFGYARLIHALDLGRTEDAWAQLEQIAYGPHATRDFGPHVSLHLTLIQIARVALAPSAADAQELIADIAPTMLSRNQEFWFPVQVSVIEAMHYAGAPVDGAFVNRLLVHATRSTGSDHPAAVRLTRLAEACARANDETTALRSPTRQKLEQLIGLEPVKAHIAQLEAAIATQEARRAVGLRPYDIGAHHLVFVGNPGTGKTTVARLISDLYQELGILKSDVFVEAGRSDLTGKYIGHSEAKTSELLEAARGGVLFIDEAYALDPGDSERDFGSKVISEIVDFTGRNEGELVVILAGYPEEMQDLLNVNPGMASRFARVFEFPDLTTDNLMDVVRSEAAAAEYRLDANAEVAMRRTLNDIPRDRNFGNARTALDVLKRSIEAHGARVAPLNDRSRATLEEIRAADIPTAQQILAMRNAANRGAPDAHHGIYL